MDVTIAAVMSVPRLGWNDHWGCTADALMKFNIPLRKFTGAFWIQCMQEAFESCVADRLDWILAIDYDTLFTARQLDEMLGLLEKHSACDALAALQSRRQDDLPLLSIPDQTHVAVDGSPIEVQSAHFGLTLIRVEALKDVPKPWFKNVPGPDGTYTHAEHIDPDIWFWKQWRACGKTAFVAPTVRVGHLKLVVGGFDENMNYQRLTVEQWQDANE